jgi:hypothetical protein
LGIVLVQSFLSRSGCSVHTQNPSIGSYSVSSRWHEKGGVNGILEEAERARLRPTSASAMAVGGDDRNPSGPQSHAGTLGAFPRKSDISEPFTRMIAIQTIYEASREYRVA